MAPAVDHVAYAVEKAGHDDLGKLGPADDNGGHDPADEYQGGGRGVAQQDVDEAGVDGHLEQDAQGEGAASPPEDQRPQEPGERPG